MALVCSSQPGKPGTPPFWTEMSMYALVVRKEVSLLARIANNIFPSTFSSEMVQNWLTVLEFLSLGVNIPSAYFQASGTSPFPQTTLRSLHSLFSRSGHILYTLYGMALGPGAEPHRAFLTTSFTSSSVGSVVTSGVSGVKAGSVLSQSPRASSLLTSECVSCRYFSTSSSGVSNVPERSLSSRIFANVYGLAVNAALFRVRSPLLFSSWSRIAAETSAVCALCHVVRTGQSVALVSCLDTASLAVWFLFSGSLCGVASGLALEPPCVSLLL